MDENTKIQKLNNDQKEKNKISDSESINHGTNNVQNIVNLPNTIKYPKGGVLNNSNANNLISNPNNSGNNSVPPNNIDDNLEGKGKRKISGKFLVCLIIIVIVYEYYTFIFWLKPLEINRNNNELYSKIIIWIIYHILLFMMLWSFIVTMRTIPGFIPLYWGFYIGDEEYKRKRYCLICNAFKPERSHHCSVCNICVLNMDHHCPWVNNCIGFYNRKFFMQLLFYLLLLLWFNLLCCIPEIYIVIKHIYQSNLHLSNEKIINYLIVIPAYIIIIVLTILNTMFFKYHFLLVLNNSTTIESLDTDNKENSKVFF